MRCNAAYGVCACDHFCVIEYCRIVSFFKSAVESEKYLPEGQALLLLHPFIHSFILAIHSVLGFLLIVCKTWSFNISFVIEEIEAQKDQEKSQDCRATRVTSCSNCALSNLLFFASHKCIYKSFVLFLPKFVICSRWAKQDLKYIFWQWELWK